MDLNSELRCAHGSGLLWVPCLPGPAVLSLPPGARAVVLPLCLGCSAFACAQVFEDRKSGSPLHSMLIANNDVLISRCLSFMFHIPVGSKLRRERHNY